MKKLNTKHTKIFENFKKPEENKYPQKAPNIQNIQATYKDRERLYARKSEC